MFKSRKSFFYFVDECNKNYRSGHDLQYYREIISMHRHYNNLENLLNDERFFNTLYNTLEKWNMNQKGAKLRSIDEIKKSILSSKPLLDELYKCKIEFMSYPIGEIGERIITLLGLVFKNLDIMNSKRRIVGVSKTMHFLLPDLILPIDGKYTMAYFYGYNKYSDNAASEFLTFKNIFINSLKLVKNLNLTSNDVNGAQWNTSIPKLIDNAIIGFFKHVDKYGEEKTLSIIKELDH